MSGVVEGPRAHRAVRSIERGVSGTGGALQFQDRDRTNAGSTLRVVGETRVPARLLVVDAVALVALELAYGHGVRLGAAFDGAPALVANT